MYVCTYICVCMPYIENVLIILFFKLFPSVCLCVSVGLLNEKCEGNAANAFDT